MDLPNVSKPCMGIELCIAKLIPFFSPRHCFQKIVYHCFKVWLFFQVVFYRFFGFFSFKSKAQFSFPSAMERFSCTSKHPRLKFTDKISESAFSEATEDLQPGPFRSSHT